MKALFIGGPYDGKYREIRGRRHVVRYPDGSRRIFDYHVFKSCTETRKAEWFFAAEEGVSDADIMNALIKRYRKD